MHRRQLIGAFGTLGFTALAGCSGDDSATTESSPTNEEATTTDKSENAMSDFTLTSPAFQAGDTIPDKYGKDYQNVNPPLSIDGVPDGAKSFTLIMDDPDAPGGTFLHWLVWNIPEDVTDIPAGWEPPEGIVQGENDFGNLGYGGPKPPSKHTYRFTLYAVDTTLGLSGSASKQAVVDAMDGHIVAQTQLTGTFAP